MPRILFAENSPAEMSDVIKELQDVHQVECVQLWSVDPAAPRVTTTDGETLFSRAQLLFANNPPVFDLLCLDIHFQGNSLGGIHLFNRLRREGYGRFWRNVAIISGHVWTYQNWIKAGLKARGEDWFNIAIFADTAMIGSNNVLNKATVADDPKTWAKRLVELASYRLE